jgi:hypothetical protein
LVKLAATLGATVAQTFQFIIVMDVELQLKTASLQIYKMIWISLSIKNWYEQHVLHEDYGVMLSCAEIEWQQWIASGRSNLLTFVPLTQIRNSIWGKQELRRILKETRGRTRTILSICN